MGNRILNMLVCCLLIAGCSEEQDDNQNRLLPPVRAVIRNASVADLLNTIESIIFLGDQESLLKVYTKQSRAAIARNIKLGLGTAGSVDALIREEMDKRFVSRGKVKLIKNNGNQYLIRWPSGKQFPLVLKKTDKGWLVDVISSSGGRILLIRE